MQKNVASQIWIVFAFQDEGGLNPGEPVTGDAANITANLYLDGSGTPNAVDDTNPTELGGGYYAFTITAAESNAESIVIAPASSTSNVNVIGCPGALYTTPANFPDLSVTATTGRVDLAAIAGTAQTANDNGADINTLITQIGTAGDGLTGIPWNAAWDAEVQSEANDALVALGLDHLLAASVTGTDVTDNSIIAKLVSSSATADWDDYVNTTDSLQAIRDRGDAAWTTGGGGSISDIIQWAPLIPNAIDLANTKSYRLGIALTNMLDDLPTTAEISPGTISIDRAAQGGTSWTSVVSDAAMSEIAGLVYYDEVFDTATGYAAGDVLRVTFKSVTVTVSANDYEIIGTTGRIFYTGIIADTPDVNIASINGSSANVAAMNLFFSIVNAGTGQLDSGSFAADAITASAIQDGSFTSAKFADSYLTAAKIAADALTAAKLASDVTTELQSGLATSAEISAVDAKIDTIDANVDSVLEDTGTTLPGLIGTPVADLATDIAGVQTAVDALPSVSDFLTTQMTESYAAQGVAPTLAQALFGIYQQMNESARVGTTVTVKKLDQSTAAYTLTLSDATNPASVTRAT